jgi:hypothetical protein
LNPILRIPDLPELLSVCEIHDRSAQQKTSQMAGFRYNAPNEIHFELYNITKLVSICESPG